MNVLLLTTHLNRGGITSYLYELTKGLRHFEHNVFIGSSGGERAEDFERLNAQLIHLNIKTKSELDPRIYLAVGKLKVLFRHRQHIDVVHSHTRITQVMGRSLQRSIKVPYISTCHGYFKNRLGRKLFPCWGDRVIAISEPVYDNLRDVFKVPEKEICLVRNGVDTEHYKFVSLEDRIKNRIRLKCEDNFVVGNVARYSSVKGQDLLIESIAKAKHDVPNIKLLLSGNGKLEAALRRQVSQLNLNDNVCFSNEAPTVYDELAACDIFAMPSRAEGLGLSIAEAQSCGLPVIGSDVGGIPTLIEHEKTGLLVPSENVNALAEAIVRLAKDKAMCESVGRQAREFVQKNFHIDSMVSKTIDCYKAVKK